MPAISAVLRIFSFQFSLLFFNISLTRPHQSHTYGSGPHQHCSVLLDNIRQRTVPKIWLSPFLVRSVQSSGKTSKWCWWQKWKLDIPQGDHLAMNLRHL